jgi:hypothetical protein
MQEETKALSIADGGIQSRSEKRRKKYSSSIADFISFPYYSPSLAES